MRAVFVGIFACCLWASCSPTWSETPPDSLAASNSSVSWNEFVVLGKLPGWQSVQVPPNRQPPQGLIQVFIPNGQTTHGWSDMVSVTTYKTAAMDPKVWVQNLIQNLKGVCRTVDVVMEEGHDQIDLARQRMKLPAAYPTYSALLHCQDPRPSHDPDMVVKKHEVMWVKAIQGFEYSHMVKRQWHGDEIEPANVLSSTEIRTEWKRWMDDVSIASSQPSSLKPVP